MDLRKVAGVSEEEGGSRLRDGLAASRAADNISLDFFTPVGIPNFAQLHTRAQCLETFAMFRKTDPKTKGEFLNNIPMFCHDRVEIGKFTTIAAWPKSLRTW